MTSANRALCHGALGAAVISGSAVLIKLSGLPPVTVAVLRTGYALPVLTLLSIIERVRYGRRSGRAVWRGLVAGAVFGVNLILQNIAIGLIGAGIATVIGNLQVLFVAFGAWWLFAERPPRRLLLALPPALFGVVLVSGALSGSFGGSPMLGALAALGNSLAYGVFLMLMRQGQRAGDRHVIAALRDVTAGACVVAALVFATGVEPAIRPIWPDHLWILLLAWGPQVLGWLLITMTLPRLPMAVSGLLLLLQPVLAMVLSRVVLDEQPSAAQLAGCVLLLTAVGFGVLRPKDRVRPVEPEPVSQPALRD